MKLARSVAAAVLLAGAASCDDRSMLVVSDPGAYAAVLNISRARVAGQPAVVQQMPLAWPSPDRVPPATSPGWEELPDVFRAAAAGTLPAPSQPFHQASFPPDVRLTSQEAILASRTERWDAFSSVLVTNDRRHALLYHESHYGNRGGLGQYVWLQRASARDGWAVRQVSVIYMA